ncbi:hypothetical protein MMPV_004974, partial [Pyropia vietnamensis]
VVMAAPTRLSPAVHADTNSPWNYTGPTGPEHWHELDDTFAMCGTGEQQSPINVVPTVPVDPSVTLFSLVKPGTATFTARTSINNVPLECASDECGTLQWHFATYSLVNVHAHAPAEHHVNGRTFPLELHFVHIAPGVPHPRIAVVSVLFELSSTPNLLLTRLLDAQGNAHGGETNSTVGITGVEWGTVERPESGFCQWEGSLTTPPCSEDLAWFMEMSAQPVTQEQVDRFREYRTQQTGLDERGNNRPLQATNGRKVTCYGPVGNIVGTNPPPAATQTPPHGATPSPPQPPTEPSNPSEPPTQPSTAPAPAPSAQPTAEEGSGAGAEPSAEVVVNPTCFPGTSMVWRPDGRAVALADVAIGAEVVTGASHGATSTLFMWSHRLPSGRHPFVRLTTASGGALTASAGHLIYASGKRVPAGAVRVGDTLERVPPPCAACVSNATTGTNTIADPVVAVTQVLGTGLYAPHVLDSVDVVVDGFRVSTLTTALPEPVAERLLAPLGWAYRHGWGSVRAFHGDGGWAAEAVRAAVAAATAVWASWGGVDVAKSMAVPR